MLILRAKLLDAKVLPARDEKFSPSCLVAAVSGRQTINLVGPGELGEQLKDVEPFTEVLFEVGFRPIDLAEHGGTGRGKAYRLRILSLLKEPEKG